MLILFPSQFTVKVITQTLTPGNNLNICFASFNVVPVYLETIAFSKNL